MYIYIQSVSLTLIDLSIYRQQLQEHINLQNMDLLAMYFEKYEKLNATLCCE